MKIAMILSLLLAGCAGILIGMYLQQPRHDVLKNFKMDAGMTFNKNIFELALQNTFFRKELVTGDYSQVVVMSIPVGGDIGLERHKVDQTLVFVQGHGQAIINGQVSDVYPQSLVFVPAGTEHNFKNIGTDELKLFTVYAPAQHKPGTVEETKSEYVD